MAPHILVTVTVFDDRARACYTVQLDGVWGISAVCDAAELWPVLAAWLPDDMRLSISTIDRRTRRQVTI
jgi:hypothetical protein